MRSFGSFLILLVPLGSLLAVDPPASPAALETPSAAPARATTSDASEVIDFVIHARYRGAVEKDFRRIGTALLATRVLAPERFEVVANAEITHPQENTQFEMQVQMTFELTGAMIRIVDKKNEFNAASKIYRYNIEQTVPFLHLVQSLPIPGPDAEPTRRFRIRGVEYDIRYRRSEKDVQAAIFDGRRLITTFFLEPAAEQRSRIRKFHVPGEGGVTVSFVARKEGVTDVTEPDEAAPESPHLGSEPAATPGN